MAVAERILHLRPDPDTRNPSGYSFSKFPRGGPCCRQRRDSQTHLDTLTLQTRSTGEDHAMNDMTLACLPSSGWAVARATSERGLNTEKNE